MKIINSACLLMLSMMFSDALMAFDMNPVYTHVTDSGGEKIKEPVHEIMTIFAYECSGDVGNNCEGKDYEGLKFRLKDSYIKCAQKYPGKCSLRDTVYGVEWNDDPDNLLRQGVFKAVQWKFMFDDAKLMAECISERGELCDHDGAKNPMMLYRSHFGDLQFLHAMAAGQSETAEQTTQKMLKWAEFAYAVYMYPEKVKDVQISSISHDMGEIINKPGWTVGALFDPEQTGYWDEKKGGNGGWRSYGRVRSENRVSEVNVKLIALGSILHMIMDSYAIGHTERINGCKPEVANKGEIISFRDYSGQDTTVHENGDAVPVWLTQDKIAKGTPIWASAKFLSLAHNNADWSEIKNLLKTEIFKLKNAQSLPSKLDNECVNGSI